MSITIELNKKQLNEDKTVKLHYLPAKINGDGEANVDKYFDNYTRKQDEIRTGLLTNAVRGYPLFGEEVEVPNGYKGLVLHETNKPMDETMDRQLRITGTFSNFTYWNYDKIPTKADGYKQALQMLDIADALSQPVEADELEQELKRHKTKLTGKKNE